MKMTGNKILLDTNIVIEVLKGNKIFADKIVRLPGFYIPTIVLGELYTGINRVTNKAKHLKMLADFLTLCRIVHIDATTSRLYGEIMATLYKKGKPLPTNDVWIAAITKQYKFTLITKDNHFKEIKNIIVKYW